MFVRWKKRISEADPWRRVNGEWIRMSKEDMPYTLSAYLVQSKRVDGKPRQEIIAFLGSITCRGIKKGEPLFNLWHGIEEIFTSLDLDQETREMVCQALAKKTPRPSAEAIEKHEQERQATIVAFGLDKPGKADAPPFLTSDTTEEIDGLKLLWDRDGPYRSFTGEQTREELYHVRLARINDKGKYKVIAKLGDISPDAVKTKRWGWKEFWYQVHSALCLAEVEPDVYNTAVHLVALRIEKPEDFCQLILEEQKRAEQKASDKEAAYWKLTKKWMDKEKELKKIQTLSQKYLIQDKVVP